MAAEDLIDSVKTDINHINEAIVDLTKMGLSVYLDTCETHVIEDGTVVEHWPDHDGLCNHLIKLNHVIKSERLYDGKSSSD